MNLTVTKSDAVLLGMLLGYGVCSVRATVLRVRDLLQYWEVETKGRDLR